ncbi:C40 family peptidase [Dactylosporangium sp. NPDC000555]|uniref:C40 family peptidase n=1 Tax=Dactylosporangium sp. NPDC000555 TaxID=3154260 RepID=UPI003333A370
MRLLATLRRLSVLQLAALGLAAAVIGGLTLGLAGPVSAGPGKCTGTTAERALCIAGQQQDDPYVWGGNGPTSFDCSGLVYYSYKKAGVQWGDMTAAGQYQYGAQKGWKVSTAHLKPGDLLYFDWDGDGDIDHTGIYAGKGKMIAASSTAGKVTTTKLTSYYTSHMLGSAIRPPANEDNKPSTGAKKDDKSSTDNKGSAASDPIVIITNIGP